MDDQHNRKRRMVRLIVLASVATVVLFAASTRRIKFIRHWGTPMGVLISFRFHVSAAIFFVPEDKSVTFQVDADERSYDPGLEIAIWMGGRNEFYCDRVPAKRQPSEE